MKKQSKMKDNRKKIEVAYFWNEKDRSKIEMIMTKNQVLYPEEKIIRVIKKMIRQIKKRAKDSAPLTKREQTIIEEVILLLKKSLK